MNEAILFVIVIIIGAVTALITPQKNRSFGQALRPFEFSNEVEGTGTNNNSREQRALIVLIFAYVIPSLINFLIWFSIDNNIIENYNDVELINIVTSGISIAALAWVCLSVKSTKWRIVTISLAFLQIFIFIYYRYQ